MITDHAIDQAMSELKETCGGVREDYFGLLYLEQEFRLPREVAINQVAFGGDDFGVDGFHFDPDKRNLYLFQFKYSKSYQQFAASMRRLIDKGLELVFARPNQDQRQNQLLVQLRSCLIENRNVIDQICIRFVFTGNPEKAENSNALSRLREDLTDRKHFIEQFFHDREVQFLIDFRSTTGKVGRPHVPQKSASFQMPLLGHVVVDGPHGQQMHVGFVRLEDLRQIHAELGTLFFDRNIRYGLGESEAVNRAISRSLRDIVINRSLDPELFAFNHNGITLYAEKFEQVDGMFYLTSPRLLNGAQTVTTVAGFFQSNSTNPKLSENHDIFKRIRVLCKIITSADPQFVTSVTINNNRQNPVEPWNLHANDLIQLQLQDKFRDDLGIYYERHENAFNQLDSEDLANYGISEDSRAI